MAEIEEKSMESSEISGKTSSIGETNASVKLFWAICNENKNKEKEKKNELAMQRKQWGEETEILLVIRITGLLWGFLRRRILRSAMSEIWRSREFFSRSLIFSFFHFQSFALFLSLWREIFNFNFYQKLKNIFFKLGQA